MFGQELDWGDWVDDAVVDGQNAGVSHIDSPPPPSTASIDHSNPVFQNDVKGWLLWLKKDVGFDVRFPQSYAMYAVFCRRNFLSIPRRVGFVHFKSSFTIKTISNGFTCQFGIEFFGIHDLVSHGLKF